MSQYVYFDISSTAVPAAAVTAHLGVQPDKLRVPVHDEPNRRFRHITPGQLNAGSRAWR